MARETAIREIGAHRYRVTQLKARIGHRVITRVLKIVGEPLGVIGESLGESDPSKVAVGDLSSDGLSQAMAKLTQALGDDDLNWIIEQFRPSIELETPGSEGQFVPMTESLWDDHFAGAFLDEAKLLAFAFEHNFASFFEGVGGIGGFVQRLTTPTSSSSTSRKTRKRGSGGSSRPSASASG